jgi:hypothetical protein
MLAPRDELKRHTTPACVTLCRVPRCADNKGVREVRPLPPNTDVLERRDSGATERHGRCSGSDRPACALEAVACRRAGTSGP